MTTRTAYVTGGASGIGLAVAKMLADCGQRVVIADRNLNAAESVANNLKVQGKIALALEVDVSNWDSQVAAFQAAVDRFGRIDGVYAIAGIGERKSIINDGKATGFAKPDLAVLDVDLTGVIWTVSLAVQQMRRQESDEGGIRGRIAVTASVCGFYCVPTVPIYTAAKHGVVGFVRSYGKYLPEERITLNAVCPNVVRTSISSEVFYDKVDSRELLTPLKGVVDAFESLVSSDASGECIEAGPEGGFQRRSPPEHLDQKTTAVLSMISDRGHSLHEPTS